MLNKMNKKSISTFFKELRTPSRFFYLIFLLILSIGVPLFQSIYLMHIFILAGFFIVVAIPYNLLFGYAGEPSLAHMAIFGLGAYVVAISTTSVGVSPWLSILLACLFTFGFSFPLGYISLRVSGVYFFLVTLSFAEIARLIVLNWADLTGGYAGISKIPHLELFGFDITNSILSYYYLVLLFVLVSLVVTYRLVHSKFGRALTAIREDVLVAESIGINATRNKLIAFMIAGLFAGLGGSLYALYFSFVDSGLLAFDYGIFLLAAIFVGGRTTVFGPAVGVYVLILLTEYLRFLQDFRLLIYGLILIIAVVFLRKGIVGAIENLTSRMKGKK